MDSLIIAAAAGLRSRLEALDVIANNIANAGAAGYKADHESGAPYVSSQAQSGAREAWRPESVIAPDNDRHWTDHSQGVLQRSSEPLDLALYGAGMFEVRTARGALWTRNGNFRVGTNGKLLTHEGYEVRVRPSGLDYRINPDESVSIQRDGTIVQNGQAIGQIEIVKFETAELLNKQGGNYFRVSDPRETPKIVFGTEVRQGYLEAANTAATQSAVRLVAVMRHFEALQRAIGIGADMNKKAVDEVGRLGS